MLFKTAEVLPLLKKPGLDRANSGNYCPISNLNAISKVMFRFDRICYHHAISTLFNWLNALDTRPKLLCWRCSIETSFYSTVNLSSSCPLDISAAFDTISHGTLLKRLEIEFSIEGIALSWLQSYLTDCSQFVKLGRHCLKTVTCSSGVPQGSVLGLLLFCHLCFTCRRPHQEPWSQSWSIRL